MKNNMPGIVYLLWYLGAVITRDCWESPSLSIYSWHVRSLWSLQNK